MLKATSFEEHATLFGQMAEQHHVQWDRASGLEIRRAINACIACREVDACRRSFADGAPTAEAAAEFCPNAGRFDAWAHRAG